MTAFIHKMGGDSVETNTVGVLFSDHTYQDTAFVGEANDNNTSVGVNTLASNTTGVHMVAVGFGALSANTIGDNNTALGNEALTANNSGSHNTAVGVNALASNTTADSNTAVGESALETNIVGDNNTAVGVNALAFNLADYNTAVGTNALGSNTTGVSNTAVGRAALFLSTTGDYNCAFGDSALNLYNGTIACNAFGTEALEHNTGGYNDAFGYQALAANTGGTFNFAFGYQAMAVGDGGSFNCAFGPFTMMNCTGSGNNGFGVANMDSLQGGTNNNAFGGNGLQNCVNGAYNTAIGDNPGVSIISGNYNTCLGAAADVGGDFNNSTAIGFSAVCSGSNQITLGNSSVVSTLLNSDTMTMTGPSSGPAITVGVINASPLYGGFMVGNALPGSAAIGGVLVQDPTGILLSLVEASGSNIQLSADSTDSTTPKLYIQLAGITDTTELRMGMLQLAGTTSGQSNIQVAAVAGTPAPMQLPTTTASSGQVLSSNGANPQVLSWKYAGALQATTKFTAQSAAIATTLLYSVGASGAGFYRISWAAVVTTADSVSSSLGGLTGFRMHYTNDNGDTIGKIDAPTTPAISANNTTGTSIAGVTCGYVNASSGINFDMGYVSNTPGQMVYSLAVTVEYLGA